MDWQKLVIKMKNNNIKKLNIKRIISLVLIISMFLTINNTYAEDAFSDKTVDKPTADNNNVISQGVIIDNESIYLKTPLNPTPSQIENKQEYDLVNNYNIDLNTIELRIKYFSPTYQYALMSGKNKILTQVYSAGGNSDNVDTIRKTEETLRAQKSTLNNEYFKYESEVSKLKAAGLSEESETMKALQSALTQINVGLATINATTTSLSSATSGYNKAIRFSNRMNNNSNIITVRKQLAKAMSSAFLSYKQLETVVNIYELQVGLYRDIYLLNQKNATLGIATTKDVIHSRTTFLNAQKSLNEYKDTMKNVKELLCINLGYKITDIDKLNFVEPEVDINYMASIVPSNDYENAYNSNSTYISFKSSGKNNSKLPQSSTQANYETGLNNIKMKVISKLEYLFSQITVANMKYQSSKIDEEILALSMKNTDRMKNEDLVSNNELSGLQIKNLSKKLDVIMAKLNLITAINEYKYAAYGILDIE